MIVATSMAWRRQTHPWAFRRPALCPEPAHRAPHPPAEMQTNSPFFQNPFEFHQKPTGRNAHHIFFAMPVKKPHCKVSLLVLLVSPQPPRQPLLSTECCSKILYRFDQQNVPMAKVGDRPDCNNRCSSDSTDLGCYHDMHRLMPQNLISPLPAWPTSWHHRWPLRQNLQNNNNLNFRAIYSPKHRHNWIAAFEPFRHIP